MMMTGMKCPKCDQPCHSQGKSTVKDSRFVETMNAIRRRRTCAHCGYKFTTYERVEDELNYTPIAENFVRAYDEMTKLFQILRSSDLIPQLPKPKGFSDRVREAIERLPETFTFRQIVSMVNSGRGPAVKDSSVWNAVKRMIGNGLELTDQHRQRGKKIIFRKPLSANDAEQSEAVA